MFTIIITAKEATGKSNKTLVSDLLMFFDDRKEIKKINCSENPMKATVEVAYEGEAVAIMRDFRHNGYYSKNYNIKLEE